MAEGIEFPQANSSLGAPTPEDAAAGTVYSLPIHRWRDLDGVPQVMSCWKLSESELKAVNESGGLIWFNCWGMTHPPMVILGENPFESKVMPR